MESKWICKYCLVLNCLLHTWHEMYSVCTVWTLTMCCFRLELFEYILPHSGHLGLPPWLALSICWWNRLWVCWSIAMLSILSFAQDWSIRFSWSLLEEVLCWRLWRLFCSFWCIIVSCSLFRLLRELRALRVCCDDCWLVAWCWWCWWWWCWSRPERSCPFELWPPPLW